MADEGKSISFKELVNVRKDEMQGMLPGFMAELTNGKDTVHVYSPTAFEKVSLKVRGKTND